MPDSISVKKPWEINLEWEWFLTDTIRMAADLHEWIGHSVYAKWNSGDRL